MTKKMKKIALFLLFCLSVFGTQKFCHKQTDGFALCKIRKAFLEKDAPSFDKEEEALFARSILSGPLHYIGRGGQCYAFATGDDRYVVKLLKYNNNYPKIWFRLCPFPFGLEKYRQEKLKKKEKKLQGEYLSYQIALQELKKETGIIYFHLHQNTLKNSRLHIIDKLNIFHTLDADQYQFYIQKKGSPFYPGLTQMIQSGKMKEAKAVIDELTAYLFKRCKKHITDGDDGIWRNFAFQEGNPFQIDIGQFSYDPSLCSDEKYQEDLLLFTKDFHRWLEINSPELAEHLIRAIANITSA
jgi:hypothetical protein